MTDQTEAAEVEVARVVFDAFYGDFARWGDRSTTALRMAHDRAEHVAAELTSVLAAAEARGAERVLAAVEAFVAEAGTPATVGAMTLRMVSTGAVVAAARAAATGGGS